MVLGGQRFLETSASDSLFACHDARSFAFPSRTTGGDTRWVLWDEGGPGNISSAHFSLCLIERRVSSSVISPQSLSAHMSGYNPKVRILLCCSIAQHDLPVPRCG